MRRALSAWLVFVMFLAPLVGNAQPGSVKILLDDGSIVGPTNPLPVTSDATGSSSSGGAVSIAGSSWPVQQGTAAATNAGWPFRLCDAGGNCVTLTANVVPIFGSVTQSGAWSVTASGTVAAQQSGPWYVISTASGTTAASGTVSAAQSGPWFVVSTASGTTTATANSTAYAGDGYVNAPGSVGSFIVPIAPGAFAAGTPAHGAYIWHVRNGTNATADCFIRRIRLDFAITTAGTGANAWQLRRTTGIAASGGTAITSAVMGRKATSTSSSTPTANCSSDGSTGSDFRYGLGAALTTTSLTNIATLTSFTPGVTVGSYTRVFDFDQHEGPLRLKPGEGVGLQMANGWLTGVQLIYGSVSFDER